MRTGSFVFRTKFSTCKNSLVYIRFCFFRFVPLSMRKSVCCIINDKAKHNADDVINSVVFILFLSRDTLQPMIVYVIKNSFGLYFEIVLKEYLSSSKGRISFNVKHLLLSREEVATNIYIMYKQRLIFARICWLLIDFCFY